LIRGEDLSDDEAAAALAALLRSLGSAFRRLAEEFANLAIEVEWRVVPDEVGRAMHARVIFARSCTSPRQERDTGCSRPSDRPEYLRADGRERRG
jgi:hypothetical protein